jgi:enoyl-CoA hydratase
MADTEQSEADGTDPVRLRHEDRISTVTLNRPAILNAIDAATTYALMDRMREADAEPSTGAIVLTGAGRAFSAGGDVRNMGKAQDNPVHHRDWHLAHTMLAVEKPVVAMVNGPAIGLGLTLALLCDCVYAADDAKLGDTHVNYGLVAGDGAAITLPLLIGPHRAKELMLSGRIFTGAEAERMGVVNHAVAPADLARETYAFAAHLAAQPPFATRATKMVVNRYLRSMMHDVLDAALGWERLSMQLPEHREALKAKGLLKDG